MFSEDSTIYWTTDSVLWWYLKIEFSEDKKIVLFIEQQILSCDGI